MQETPSSGKRPVTRKRAVSSLNALVVAAALSLSAVTLPASADNAAPVPSVAAVGTIAGSAPDAPFAPALDAIAATLRDRFHVAYAEARTIAHAVQAESERYGLAPALLLAIIAVESSFDRHAVSGAGARGLMQVLPASHRDLVAHVKDLSDPATNVRIGAAIFRGYLDDEDGDVEAALVRYNGGTKRYAQRVVLRVQQFDAQLRRTAGNPSGEPRAADNP
ncbi:lytic transglycosylase domain-containing protein [Burkholderia ubonensis]|uniref:lytic transglycosylase domain-containing protein n=1 Tax=Burkholderia ubonensis TaxID=101571 RepID=UPI0009B4FAC3|nr:lytic transglycosylase domain-containing protein [Burkholderia ubonensis]